MAPEGVGGVNSANTRLAAAFLQQYVGEQRQGHAGHKRRGQHNGQRNRVTDDRITGKAGSGGLQGAAYPGHPLEAHDIDRNGQQRQRPHDQLHIAGKSNGLVHPIDALLDPQAAERESGNKRAEHEFEGMRGRAQHEAQHTNPGNFVDKRRHPRDESRHQEQARQRGGARIGWRRQALGLRLRVQANKRPNRQRQRDVEQSRGHDRAGQAERANHHEAAYQHADRGADAVGEIEHRNAATGGVGEAAQDAGAHQREGHAQQYRLRQDQQAGRQPFDRDAERRGAHRRQYRRVEGLDQAAEHIVEQQRHHADDGLHQRVGEDRYAHLRGEAAGQLRTDGHAAHKDDQHQRLGVGGVAEEKLQVMRPDGLIDQAGEPRYCENRKIQGPRRGELESFDLAGTAVWHGNYR